MQLKHYLTTTCVFAGICYSQVSANSFAGAQANSLLGMHQPDAPSISVYPNPARGGIILRLLNTYPKFEQVEIYNSTGALMLQQDAEPLMQLDVSYLPSGLYFIRVTNSPLSGSFIME